tara:strand:+ start:33114 stop:33695 length:582 start_codon:yes stop_codon:yes gene_type:complete
MAKRVFIVHGWDGFPGEGWFPWLKMELEAKGFEVFVPQMPDASNPRIQNWVPAVKQVVGSPDQDTYFVGHSMGCQAIARYLESLPEDVVVGGAIFVAGFFKRLTGVDNNPEEKEIDRHWLTTPLDLAKVKPHLKRSVALFSDDDPFVPADNQGDFKEKLGSEVIVEHGKKHFSGSTGTLEIPVVLEKLLEMAK